MCVPPHHVPTIEFSDDDEGGGAAKRGDDDADDVAEDDDDDAYGESDDAFEVATPTPRKGKGKGFRGGSPRAPSVADDDDAIDEVRRSM